jgi:hypothetical protein
MNECFYGSDVKEREDQFFSINCDNHKCKQIGSKKARHLPFTFSVDVAKQIFIQMISNEHLYPQYEVRRVVGKKVNA